MFKKSKKCENEQCDVSNILEKFGKYQILQYFYACLPAMFVSMINVNYIFVAGEVDHRCRIPECESSSPEMAVSWWPVAHVDHCSKPVVNSTFLEDNLCTNLSFTGAVEECKDWIYENNNTVFSMLNLACHPWKLSLIGAIHNIGMAIATLVAGWMADRFGRKPIVVISSIGCFIGNLKTLATSYPVYITLEFLEAVICGGVYSVGSVIMIEIGNKKNRMLAGVLFAYAIYMGEAIFAVVAMLVSYWKTLIHIVCSPTLLFVAYVFLVRESPRWQILNGKAVPVKNTLKLIVKTNKLNVKTEDIDSLDEEKLKSTYSMESNATKEGFREVFRCREVLKRFLVATACRFTVTFIYYGLIINSVWLPGNKYTNFLLAAVMSFPGELLSMYLMNKVGRKKPLMYGYLLSGIACIACGFVPGSITWLKISLFLLGKLVTAACYTGIVTYSMELFPTSVRGSMMGLCTLASSVGNMVAPLTPVLASISPVLAPVCFGCTAVIASCLLILTPETRDLPLMDTIDQVARSVAIGNDNTTKENKKSNGNMENCEDSRRGEVF
ncbi:organic cation transporter protein-like [Maniola hyperantus]|uniref:organic cation transporter protein-like n=1 Tax=Aphantopus hyperantus TaxID=2795564 RepID=UPI0015682FF4|nr:organic cation transporter protein-like [Maniola hyperantus]XP_034826800.1 organic cation transporter protein-like [Maniola hyperantus]